MIRLVALDQRLEGGDLMRGLFGANTGDEFDGLCLEQVDLCLNLRLFHEQLIRPFDLLGLDLDLDALQFCLFDHHLRVRQRLRVLLTEVERLNVLDFERFEVSALCLIPVEAWTRERGLTHCGCLHDLHGR